MRIVTLKKEEFDDFSSRHKYNTYFQSSLYADFAKANDQYNIHYLGFVDDSNNLIGASLMLYKTLFWGYKFAYAPRGFLMDYENIETINMVTRELKALLKKQKFIFVTIDPPLVASERDKNGKIIKFNSDINQILKAFQNNNYEHLGFNLYNETIQPRWNVIARLNKDGRILYNNFDSNIKEKISYANDIALTVKEDTDLDVEKFYSIVKGAYKNNKRFIENLYNTFGKNNKLRIFYAAIDTKKYGENVNRLYAIEEERNIDLGNIIQSGDSIKYNIQKAINDKLESDKLLHKYKKDVIASSKLLKNNPDGIICGAAMTIEDAHGVNILINCINTQYASYNPDIILTYEIMKYYGKMDYKYINIGAVTGNFDSSSKYYKLLENKLGFNSSIIEYVGQFNIILNPAMYAIYKKKYNKKGITK